MSNSHGKPSGISTLDSDTIHFQRQARYVRAWRRAVTARVHAGSKSFTSTLRSSGSGLVRRPHARCTNRDAPYKRET